MFPTNAPEAYQAEEAVKRALVQTPFEFTTIPDFRIQPLKVFTPLDALKLADETTPFDVIERKILVRNKAERILSRQAQLADFTSDAKATSDLLTRLDLTCRRRTWGQSMEDFLGVELDGVVIALLMKTTFAVTLAMALPTSYDYEKLNDNYRTWYETVRTITRAPGSRILIGYDGGFTLLPKLGDKSHPRLQNGTGTKFDLGSDKACSKAVEKFTKCIKLRGIYRDCAGVQQFEESVFDYIDSVRDVVRARIAAAVVLATRADHGNVAFVTQIKVPVVDDVGHDLIHGPCPARLLESDLQRVEKAIEIAVRCGHTSPKNVIIAIASLCLPECCNYRRASFSCNDASRFKSMLNAWIVALTVSEHIATMFGGRMSVKRTQDTMVDWLRRNTDSQDKLLIESVAGPVYKSDYHDDLDAISTDRTRLALSCAYALSQFRPIDAGMVGIKAFRSIIVRDVCAALDISYDDMHAVVKPFSLEDEGYYFKEVEVVRNQPCKEVALEDAQRGRLGAFYYENAQAVRAVMNQESCAVDILIANLIQDSNNRVSLVQSS